MMTMTMTLWNNDTNKLVIGLATGKADNNDNLKPLATQQQNSPPDNFDCDNDAEEHCDDYDDDASVRYPPLPSPQSNVSIPSFKKASPQLLHYKVSLKNVVRLVTLALKFQKKAKLVKKH
jgi:hypothetical protein